MTNYQARNVHSERDAHSEPRERFESNDSEDQPLADAILELRVEAEQIEEAMWTIRKVLGRDNVAAFRVSEKLKRCLEANLAAIKKLESKSSKRKEKESGQND